MSIATAITNLQGKIANAYTAIENKGGTLPATQDAANLSATIDGIPAGSSSKFGATIDDVFQTTTTGGETTLSVFGGVTDLTFTGVTKILEFGIAYKFYSSPVTSISFPALSSVGRGAFMGTFAFCEGLSSVSFPNLVELGGSSVMKECFKGCKSLISVSFPELSDVNGQDGMNEIFSGCTALTFVSFPKVKQVNGNRVFGDAFRNTAVTTLSFPELSAIRNAGTSTLAAPFANNVTLTRIDLPKLTVMASGNTDNVDARYLFNSCTRLVEIHFAAENQALIEGATYYSSKWGAPSTCTIYFDL